MPETTRGYTYDEAKLSAWLNDFGPATMRWCARCTNTVPVVERRYCAMDGVRTVEKTCERCGSFFSRTTLPPLK